MPRWTPFEPYFWSLVDKSGECWIWLGGFDGKGYARVWRDGRRQSAHRVAYELVNGKIEVGKLACHHCDNKKCVRPDHLFIGTQKDNMQDWTRKGKNRLANNRSLWSMGRHFKKADARAKVAASMKKQYLTGRRKGLRGNNGRYQGSRMC